MKIRLKEIKIDNPTQSFGITVDGKRIEFTPDEFGLIDASGQNLKSLTIRDKDAKDLHCSKNQLTSLNVRGLTNLEVLYCHDNQLTSLNLQGLTNLVNLFCINNKLDSLNVQGLTNLKHLNYDEDKTKLIGKETTQLQEIKTKIRESIYKLLEEQTKFQPGDTVSTSKDGEGSIVLSKHPYYSVKLDTTGVTKSYHFTELQQVEPTESEFGKYDIGDENSQENELDKELDGLQEIKIDKPLSKYATEEQKINKIYSELEKKHPNYHPETLYRMAISIYEKTKQNINESPTDKIVKFDGILTIQEGEYLTDILSDIRSLQGITIVKNEDIVDEDFKTRLKLKVDPYPFGDQGEQKIISYLIKKIKQIPGVRDFQKTKHVEKDKTDIPQFKSPTPVKSIEDLLKENKIRLKK